MEDQIRIQTINNLVKDHTFQATLSGIKVQAIDTILKSQHNIQEKRAWIKQRNLYKRQRFHNLLIVSQLQDLLKLQ